MPLADSLGAMDALVKAGKIRAIGLSQYSAERLDEAMRAAEANGLTRPCALQTWYNMVERPKLEGELRDTALAHGMGIVPFYGLANGFLTGKYRSKDDLEKSVRGLRNVEYLEGRGMRVLEALDRVAAETGAALATIALAWTNAQPGITSTLASATSVDQLRAVDRGHAPSPDAGTAGAARRGEPLVVSLVWRMPSSRSAHCRRSSASACRLICRVALDTADHAAPANSRSRLVSGSRFGFSGKMQLCHGRAMAKAGKLVSRLSTNGGPDATNR